MRVPDTVNGLVVDPSVPEPGWTYPDVCDAGLPCALASLVGAYARGDAAAAVEWARNASSRLWFGAMWDHRYSQARAAENLLRVASLAAQAVAATGASFSDYIPDPYSYEALEQTPFYRAVLGFCREVEPLDESDVDRYATVQDRPMRADGVDWQTVENAAMALRYFWIGRLHEANRRWLPDSDFQTATVWARKALPDMAEGESALDVLSRLHAIITEPIYFTNSDDIGVNP